MSRFVTIPVMGHWYIYGRLDTVMGDWVQSRAIGYNNVRLGGSNGRFRAVMGNWWQ
jgi:hypothetical protein